MVSLAETVDVVLWTQKAERDYRARHPHRKPARKAGEMALYDGKAVNPESSIYEAYFMRGWVVVERKEKEINAEERWNTVKKMLAENKHFGEIACALDISDMQLKYWCLHNGRELAKKYGKLPYVPRRMSPLWDDIMEPKPTNSFEAERRAKRKRRWKYLQSEVKKGTRWEKVAESYGVTQKGFKAFISNWGADLSEECGKLPFNDSAPKFLKRYMEVS